MFFFFILYKGNYTWYECNMHFTALFSQRAAEEIQNFGFGLEFRAGSRFFDHGRVFAAILGGRNSICEIARLRRVSR